MALYYSVFFEAWTTSNMTSSFLTKYLEQLKEAKLKTVFRVKQQCIERKAGKIFEQTSDVDPL